MDSNRAYAQVIEEADNLSGLTRLYLHGDDLISQSRISGNDVSTAQSDTYLYDGLGSVRTLTDSTGAITDTYTYEAFGGLDTHTGTTENRYLFTGEQFDPNVGFYYLRARYYNPSIGRFQTMDTYAGRMHEPQTLHKYLYVHANPVNNIDPSGLVALADVSAAIRVQASLALRTSGNLLKGIAGRNAATRVLFGNPPKDFGVLGSAIERLVESAISPYLGTALNGYTPATFGTGVHRDLQGLVESGGIVSLEPFADLVLTAEVFFLQPDNNGNPRRADRRRERGSLGIDILVEYQKEAVLGLDLKTGRPGSTRRNKNLFNRLGVDIVEIDVEFFGE